MTTPTIGRHTAPPAIHRDPAAIIAAAADLIATNGLHTSDWWPHASGRDRWRPHLPCCTVGAIAVTTGHRTVGAVETQLLDGPAGALHPAVRAVMAHIGADTIVALTAWSDSTRPAEVVAVLRRCADELRRGTATVEAVTG